VVHVTDRQAFDHLANRRDELVKRLRVRIEVDEYKAREHDHVNGA
jgi:hypothetical protein